MTTDAIKGFPKDFRWGAATASYQIEGAKDEDGKGPSVWDMVCRQPGFVWEGHTGDVACDHYHRLEEDIQLMKACGLRAYRFSLSWPRIIPDGNGTVNEAGLAFYDRLIDALLEADIEPWITLFHWDYPYALFCQGGWLNPRSPEWFEDYTRVVVKRYSDRVRHWFTLNEPQCFIGFGHDVGSHAPGLRLGLSEVLLAGHHTLLAHGRAAQILRAEARTPAQIGWAPVGCITFPATDRPEDVEAARKEMFDIKASSDPHNNVFNNTWWGDPVVFGRYPEDGLRIFGSAMPRVTEADMQLIAQPLDFYGGNIYCGSTVRAGADGEAEHVETTPGHPLTLYGWKCKPETLRWGVRFLYERYNLPIVVTENGISCMDWVMEDGAVHDPQRIDYLSRHLKALRQAITEGADVRGYFHWSLMDNFEWSEGYKQRFGLVHVDFGTLQRTPKDSASWYAEVCRTNGANL